MRKALVLLLAVLILPTGLLAQSLGEVAAQEKARREKEKAKDTSRRAGPRPSPTTISSPGRSTSDARRLPSRALRPSTPSRGRGRGEGSCRIGAEGRVASQRAAAARQVVETARQAVSSIANDVERHPAGPEPHEPHLQPRRLQPHPQAAARAQRGRGPPRGGQSAGGGGGEGLQGLRGRSAPQRACPRAGSSPSSERRPRTFRLADILVVEDKESLRAMLRKTLEGRGYAVDEAGDAYEARRQHPGRAATWSS